jgi:hypothetical protein
MNALPAHINIAHARLPETYASAKTALANCASIDECQDWANKAEALASYARMSDDEQLENLAKRIRARAIRRCGELLKSFDADKGGRPRKNLSPDADEFFRDPTTILGPITRGEAAERAGISRDQMHTAMKVADVPQEKFDAAVESNQPPGVKRLAASLKPQMQTPEGFAKRRKPSGRSPILLASVNAKTQRSSPAVCSNLKRMRYESRSPLLTNGSTVLLSA